MIRFRLLFINKSNYSNAAIMQMLYRDGRARPTPDQLEAEERKKTEEEDIEAKDFRKRMNIDRSIFDKDQERRADLHL